MEPLSDAAKYVLRFVNQTNRSIFLTGKAGTGKTTLLKEIISTTHKNTVVLAPTGIAALNAAGVTIHSMFQLPFAAFIPDVNAIPPLSSEARFETRATLRRHFKVSGLKKAVIRNMQLLVIDEVSMLRADLLDAVDFMMQSVRKNGQPFGGVQVLYIGDLLQLPPVIKNDEWNVLRRYYHGKFFFHSHAVLRDAPLYVELSKIYRQSDTDFIEILNNLRNNRISDNDLQILNAFVDPHFNLQNNPGYITLTTHNAKADAINYKALDDLAGEIFTYAPEIIGDFPDKIFPVDPALRLKIGAQIMFIKNDPSPAKNFFNGKTGIVKSLSDAEILVHFPEENLTIEVERYEWQNIRYYVDSNTKDVAEEVLGTYVHYPIKLAWAITVHKSQGLTFDRAALDVSQVFQPGQAYVALSRLRSLKGLILLSPLQMNGIENDSDVVRYAESKVDPDDLEPSLQIETRKYVHQYLRNAFDWSNLVQEWRNHKFSYDDDVKNSEKAKSKKWAQHHLETIEQLIPTSLGFLAQIDRIFKSDAPDLKLLTARVDAAVNYFLPIHDGVVGELLTKIELIRQAKKN
ncbi:MAG: AAA family ATPase [Flavobacterium sp.]|nr:AAA family ATPase [Flavobacterium sp.]